MATSSSSTVASFYLAYYGRPADPAGLAYWTAQLEQAGGNFGAIIESFSNSTESTARFGTLTPEERIAQIYSELLGREPEPAGAAYWLNQITSGNLSIAELALTIQQNALGNDAVTVTARLDAAEQFTAYVVANNVPYSGLQAAEAVKLVIASVTHANVSTLDMAAVIESVAQLARVATETPEVIAAMTGGGSLASLLQAGIGASDPLAMVNFITATATAANGDPTALKTLLGSGNLVDYIAALPEDVTLNEVTTAIQSGGLDAGAEIAPPPDDTGTVAPPAGGGGGGSETPTFTVTNDGSGNFTVGTQNGNVVVTFDSGAQTLTFTPASGTPVVINDNDVNSLIVNTITLTGTAAAVDGVTITGTGTVAITALHSSAVADLSNIATTTVTATVADSVDFLGMLGKAQVTVSSGTMDVSAATVGTATFVVSPGATLEGTHSTLSGKTITGTGNVAIAIDTTTDTSNFAAGLNVSAVVLGEFSVVGTGNMSRVDGYYIETASMLYLTAGQASGRPIEGSGGVTITGYDGNQFLNIQTTGTNIIAGGKGADQITLGLGDGQDTVVVNGGTPATGLFTADLTIADLEDAAENDTVTVTIGEVDYVFTLDSEGEWQPEAEQETYALTVVGTTATITAATAFSITAAESSLASRVGESTATLMLEDPVAATGVEEEVGPFTADLTIADLEDAAENDTVTVTIGEVEYVFTLDSEGEWQPEAEQETYALTVVGTTATITAATAFSITAAESSLASRVGESTATLMLEDPVAAVEDAGIASDSTHLAYDTIENFVIGTDILSFGDGWSISLVDDTDGSVEVNEVVFSVENGVATVTSEGHSPDDIFAALVGYVGRHEKALAYSDGSNTIIFKGDGVDGLQESDVVVVLAGVQVTDLGQVFAPAPPVE